MKIIKNIIWRWKTKKRFDKIYKLYSCNLNIFHYKERESIRTIKNLFNFFFYRKSWERNKDKIEKEIENLNIKINHRININNRIKNKLWKL